MQSRQTDATWYVRESFGDHGRQLWRFQDYAATRMGVTSPETGPGSYFRAEPGETFLECIARQTPWLEPGSPGGQFVEMLRRPGEYYPRMARPLALMVQPQLWLPGFSADRGYIAGAQSQLTSLTHQLGAICRVVQPSTQTLQVYGHDIRNLLILAATEVEMHWRGIFAANGRAVRDLKTKDYVKLADPLLLRDYQVSFYPFPNIDPLRPFAGWSADKSTGSLPWYAAYNGVKHNREHEFERATLEHAFEALAACVVLLIAQFGRTALTSDLSTFFEIEAPSWPLEKMYLSPENVPDWTAISHPGLL